MTELSDWAPGWGLRWLLDKGEISENANFALFSSQNGLTYMGFAPNWLKRTIWHLSEPFLPQEAPYRRPLGELAEFAPNCLSVRKWPFFGGQISAVIAPFELKIDVGALQGQREPSHKF